MRYKQRHVSYMRKTSAFFILPFFMINIVACENEVIKTTTDSTKLIKTTTNSTLPDVHWDIMHPDTREHRLINESGQKRDIDKTKIYFTTCKAANPKGLQKISIGIKANLYCQKLENGAVYDKHYTYNTGKKVDLPADSEGTLSININGSGWVGVNCNNGFKSVSVASYILECKAWNRPDMAATQSLTLINK